jgi:hypothetical protein
MSKLMSFSTSIEPYPADVAHRDDRRRALGHRRLFGPCEAAHGPEGFGVILRRRFQHGAGVGLLHLLALQQDFDLVGHLRHHGEVVGDVDRGSVELLDDVADGGQHLDLGRDVERGGRLIEDDEVGAAGHRHRRHRALQLPARDLVRIAEADLVGVRQLHPAVEVHRVLLGLGPGHDVVLDRRLGVLVDQLVGRVEARRSRLRDIGDALAAQAAALGIGGLAQVDPVEQDLAARDAAAVAREAHGRKPDGGLARPGFADQAQDLALVQGQVDALDDLQPFLVGAALDPKAFHGQEDVLVGLGHRITPSARWRGAAASRRRSSR